MIIGSSGWLGVAHGAPLETNVTKVTKPFF
jgi:hypothetical protein